MREKIAKFFSEASVSLKYRNMQLYASAATISLLGSMMQESMIAWVVYQLTGSVAVLGNIMSWFMVPMIAASMAGGWVADRFNRKRVVITTQSIALLIALAYAGMALTHSINIQAVYALSAIFGVNVAFEMSSRMAMLPRLVDDPAHIGNAFALDSLIFYSCRLLGPAVGALFLVLTGPTLGFVANAATYVIELVLLAKIKVSLPSNAAEKATLKEAFKFAYGNRRRRQVMLLLAAVTFFGVYIQMMPAFTALRHGSALANGFLILFSEIGAVLASVIIANKTADANFVKRLRTSIGWAAVLFAICMAVFSATTEMLTSLLLMIPTGFAMSAVFTGSQAILQVEVDDRIRGAFTAMFYNFSYFGMLAIGGPILGHLALRFGLPTTMCGACAVCLLLSGYYLLVEGKPDQSFGENNSH